MKSGSPKTSNLTQLNGKKKKELKREGLKSNNKPELVINGRTHLQSLTFINDAANVWNNAPCVIKECISLSSVKKQIKIYISSWPVVISKYYESIQTGLLSIQIDKYKTGSVFRSKFVCYSDGYGMLVCVFEICVLFGAYLKFGTFEWQLIFNKILFGKL